MKQQIEIPVEPRSIGKALNNKLRKEGGIPGVVYNSKIGPTNLSLPERSVFKYLGQAYENTIFTLKSSDKKLDNLKVLFKEKSVHPLTRKLWHIDFFAVDMNKAVRVRVEVKFEGKPIGLTEGGMFQAVLRDLEIEVLPDKIPDSLTVDISNLGVHDSLHASDVQLPDGVKLITDASVTLCTVTIVEEEAAVTVAAVAAAPTEIELSVQKGKKDEEGAPVAAGAKPGAAPAKAAAAPAAKDKK